MMYPKRKIRKLIANGEYAEAIAFGKQIEAKHADDQDFLFIMGSAYFIVEDAQTALEYFDRVLKIKGDDIDALKLKTNAHLALNQKDDAVVTVSRVLEVRPDDAEAQALFDELQGVT